MSSSPLLRTRSFAGGALILVALSLPAQADRPSVENERERHARQLAETGMLFDLEGQEQYARFTWLAALRVDPDCLLARSRLGYVRQGDNWIPAVQDASSSSTATRSAAAKLRSDYQGYRQGRLDRGQAELTLGIWCQSQGLDDLANVHLRRVVQNPQLDSAIQLAAARRLNLQSYDGRWFTRDEMFELQATLQQAQQNLRTWSQRIAKDVRRLQSNRASQRSQAIEALRQIEDPAAIPAMELLMSTQDESMASEAVGILARMSHPEAAESLTRHAVAAPWTRVREEAIVQLAKRPYHDFVPVLLRGLVAPIRSVFQVTPGPAGQILHEHVLFQEGAEANLQLELRAMSVAAADPESGQRQITPGQERRVMDQVRQIEQAVATRNRQVMQQNSQIYSVLHQTTHQTLQNTPGAWWDWWREYNEYERADAKPTRRYRNSYTYQDFAPRSCECFPAGTLVWTEEGRSTIERIQVGDRVLSQDPETGTLLFKPVSDVTRRSQAAMQRIQVGNAWVTLTTGHPLWVNRHGWRMAKFLRLGDSIHTMHGAQPVNSLAVAPAGDAFNLVVEDFGTYFVTEEGILVHDNDERSPTRVQTPGLLARNDS